MCFPVDLRAFLYGFWFTVWGLFIYLSYKRQQRLQKNYETYANALLRFGDKPINETV